jgi:3-oxoacyl-[acyl-carrier protein] reductase
VTRQPELAGKTALVTGGGTGLGREIALGLARAGADVAVNYSRSREEALATVAEIEALGRRSICVAGDVADEAGVAAMAGEIERRLAPVQILVNNAGITRAARFADLAALSAADWQRIYAVNVVGAFLCARAVAPAMREAGWGRMLNVASNSAQLADGSSIAYVVSKAAVISLTQCLARALAPAVNVNAIAPGWLETRWLERNVQPETRARVLSGELPSASLQDVARAAIELVCNDGITGQTLVVDGGEVSR